MMIFNLQLMREKFAEALERPRLEVLFIRPGTGEGEIPHRQQELCFALTGSGRAIVVPPGWRGRELLEREPGDVHLFLSEKNIVLAHFGEPAEDGDETPEPDVWYRTREGAGTLLEDLFRSLCRLESGSRAAQPLLRSICELIAERLENEVEQQLSGEEQLWIRIRDRIGRCFREDLSREAMAEMLRIHPARLSRLVRKFAGTGVCDYVRDLRLHCAEELLMAREVIPIEEISRRCGFNSASYFISIFRRKYGVSPGTFRRRHLDL
ncbi:AraC family transcriptional regulator [uncultured Victivallis sp.]|uniref:helix-turn-helix transcriptional regulator n=1 Tax=uncultured Victivallis sp. TaxID=354118 RepID=UPI0025D0D6C4|nr:AraC family transcriptional regulator [uncultured Victivallis sp.]